MLARTAKADAPADFLRRLFVASAVAVLLLLSVASVSPAVHQWLHGDSAPDSTDNCAVVHFAAGLTIAAAAIVVAAPGLAWREAPARVATEIFLASPRYLRQPERGPPVC